MATTGDRNLAIDNGTYRRCANRAGRDVRKRGARHRALIHVETIAPLLELWRSLQRKSLACLAPLDSTVSLGSAPLIRRLGGAQTTLRDVRD